MQKFYLLLFLPLLLTLGIKAQGTWPPLFEIKADTAKTIRVPDQYWQILEDASEKLTFDQIRSGPYASRFHMNTTRTKGYNYHINTYWLRYRFKNALNRPVKITIPENVAYADLYAENGNSKWVKQRTGKLLPWDERDGLKQITQFVVNIQPGQTITFYEKDVIDFRLYKPQYSQLIIGAADKVIKDTYIDKADDMYKLAVYAGMMGFLLAAAIFNLFFYSVVREKAYLYFAAFLVLYGLDDLIAGTELVKMHNRYLSFYSTSLIRIADLFVSVYFIRNYLSTKNYTPKLDKFLVIVSYVFVISLILLLFSPGSISFEGQLIVNLLRSVITCIYSFILLLVLIFYLFKIKHGNKTGILAILPGSIWLNFSPMCYFICRFLHDTLNRPYPPIYFWLYRYDNVVDWACSSLIVIVFSWLLFKRYKNLQDSLVRKEIERNQLIEGQKQELEQQVNIRTAELKKSIEELKQIQQQLVQSEKLASLGELTAGIAHEIQNPLNFVNNFSEVSIEIVNEIRDELKGGNTGEALALTDDVEQNLVKIIHHGKRADGIVKNMLQHSRSSSGEKIATDINALADEYLRLSYHGLRAKDKSFNAAMSTCFDPNLPLIKIVPQDISRVLLNLFNNAFYAVRQKEKVAKGNYHPEVKVTTRLTNNFVEIEVWDNGSGIPENIKDKILQPFFTTKPTGEGTGLGLSLSYDIIAKGHNGTMTINSEEGKFSAFTISIPINYTT